MTPSKRYGIYVVAIKKRKDDIFWFKTEKERDEEFNKLKKSANFMVKKVER